MQSEEFTFDTPRLRSSWPTSAFIMKGKLTDKAIRKYEEAGYYSPERKAARKKLMMERAKKRKRHAQDPQGRRGNFIFKADGTKVYSPL